MPTTRPREHVVPTNLPPRLKSEEICPILHSGDRLSEETYAGIAADLAAGQTVSRIVRRWKTHHCTVAAVRTREAAVIEKQREHLKSLLAVAVQLSVEKLIEALDEDKVPAGALALATGILWDKHRQAEGEPTQVIEVKRTATLDQVKKELDSLKQAEVIDISEDKGKIRERMIPNPYPVEGDEDKPVKELYLEDSSSESSDSPTL